MSFREKVYVDKRPPCNLVEFSLHRLDGDDDHALSFRVAAKLLRQLELRFRVEEEGGGERERERDSGHPRIFM